MNQKQDNAYKPFMVYEIRRPGQPTAKLVFCRTEQNRDLPPVRYGVEIDEDGNSRPFGPVKG